MGDGLLLVAHGSRDPRAAEVAHAVAAEAQAAVPGLTAVAAFLELAEPNPGAALDTLATQGVDRVRVLPFLLSHAYHSKVDLPKVEALVAGRGWEARTCGVLGPDDLLLDALIHRLRAGALAYDTVVLAAAGSTDPDANVTVEGIAQALSARTGVRVLCGFASAAKPTVGEAVAQARESGAQRVGVAMYLLAPGFFADRVRTDALEAGAAGVAAPLGACPEIVELVLRRAGLR
ncbi:sirohydrochlorin chelatase [Actinopolymorpha alba]|uniref:sirohydrochlorin chelatase n=1 Tax=Actinopolymorpha alba TaxID=533267 RepID=UPI00035F1A6C|nr:CbiX/SirB N-terminal domain-containing protein [Actinopolymorpha alba]